MTDTDEMTEKIEKALWGLTRVYDAPHGHGTEVGVHAPVHEVVAAVLPIISAEVQAGKAEAWDEGALDAIHGFDIEDRYTDPINPYRETGDQR